MFKQDCDREGLATCVKGRSRVRRMCPILNVYLALDDSSCLSTYQHDQMMFTAENLIS